MLTCNISITLSNYQKTHDQIEIKHELCHEKEEFLSWKNIKGKKRK